MQLTKTVIEHHRFKRINNSMWRLNNIILQSTYLHKGDEFWDRIMSAQKAYRVTFNGKYIDTITKEEELKKIISKYNRNKMP